MSLVSRLALVTGAAGGISQSICRVLSREGCSVIGTRMNTEKEDVVLSACVHDLKDQKHASYTVDVSNAGEVKTLFSDVLKEYGRPPDIIVNNAGIVKDGYLLKMKDEDFDKVIDVNLKGTYLMTKHASQAMKRAQKAGSIVNISSVVGKTGNVGQTNYSASKGGVISFTKSAAKELAKFHIRVNCICPGFIDTPMTKDLPEHVKQMVLFAIPLGCYGEPEDIAETVAFLASSKAKYITGTSVDVNGGML
uniref:(3R)-3-hydroxyacyl-CoA dehydrogenase n=2 Tax=Lepeophtheirus salmonis TaxID=72036 RepID=D3PHL6_LEPSM|nr:Estradiol 17-beta-dehydrogenase 8 [Lepeophtheirus salmonis]